MNILILISCTIAAASATYYGPQHIPVIGPNGVPVEPHEVQAARASHLAAVASAKGAAAPYYSPGLAYPAYGVPVLGHNALPLDTPEVAAAKVQHYRDFAVAAQRNGVHVGAVHAAGPYPVDTPEVQLAKAAHFHAHAEAAARAGHANYLGHYRRRRDVYGGYHIPVIGPNGVPLDTPEVQAAKSSHLAALAEAASRAGAGSYGYAGTGAYSPGAYSEHYTHRYYGPLATIGPDGKPVETPEVKAATAYHLAAHAAARSGAYHGSGHYY